jgi:hypothetical protein
MWNLQTTKTALIPVKLILRGAIYLCRLADLYEHRFVGFVFYNLGFQDPPLLAKYEDILAWVSLSVFKSKAHGYIEQ